MNPLLQLQNNPMLNLIQTLRSGISPQKIAQNIINNNPQAANMLKQMQTACGNQDPKTFVLEQCKNNGVEESQVLEIAKMMGLK